MQLPDTPSDGDRAMMAPEVENGPQQTLSDAATQGWWGDSWFVRFLIGSGERRARLRTLTLIRWVAIVGQGFTILLVDLSLEFDLPLPPLLLAVALSGLINLYLELGFSASTRLTERAAALLLGYDLLQLTFLLALTGGLQNPFSVLLIIPITLSATILSLRTTVILCIMVTACATLLAILPTSLPWKDGGLVLPPLYLVAVWVALVLSSTLIAAYAWRVADEARRLSAALSATQMALAREQQMSALGGLAAAAAHELGSPLATIAITAKELANNTPADSPMAEDVAELISQSARCREILASLSKDKSAEDHTAFTCIPLGSLLSTLADAYRRPGITVTVEVDDQAKGSRAEPSWAPTPELRHALGNLVDNAIQFAERSVLINVVLRANGVDIVIEDDGPGFSPEVLDLVGEPYISTRHAIGGLGLGVFIAQTLLARTGATLQFGNQMSGAQVVISWAGPAMEQMNRRSDHE
ncbi:MAG: ActS/PrrB/RegB family redox-sensitive histidine kinase [Geminicoccaceae bacterium]